MFFMGLGREIERRNVRVGRRDAPVYLAVTLDKRDAIRSYFLDGASDVGQCPTIEAMTCFFFRVFRVFTIGGPVLSQGT